MLSAFLDFQDRGDLQNQLSLRRRALAPLQLDSWLDYALDNKRHLLNASKNQTNRPANTAA